MNMIDLTPISEKDKRLGLLVAVTRMSESLERWKRRMYQEMSDNQLEEIIRYELGIFGGLSGTDKHPAVEFSRSGLRLWISRGGFMNTVLDEPTIQGKETIDLIRDIFSIKESGIDQYSLF